MRRLVLMLTLLLVATPALAGQRFSFNRYGDDTYDRNTDDGGGCKPPPSVPEPTALALFAAGAGVIGWKLGRRRQS